jgi:hypothetical protein
MFLIIKKTFNHPISINYLISRGQELVKLIIPSLEYNRIVFKYLLMSIIILLNWHELSLTIGHLGKVYSIQHYVIKFVSDLR